MSMYQQYAGKALIIANADLNDYLIATANEKGRLTGLNGGGILHANSLANAKSAINPNQFQSAYLLMQTPYDEMCGLPQDGITVMELPL